MSRTKKWKKYEHKNGEIAQARMFGVFAAFAFIGVVRYFILLA